MLCSNGDRGATGNRTSACSGTGTNRFGPWPAGAWAACGRARDTRLERPVAVKATPEGELGPGTPVTLTCAVAPGPVPEAPAGDQGVDDEGEGAGNGGGKQDEGED